MFAFEKQDKSRRWACSTIERGYSPAEARELRAIASFHHPSGFAYGYMKMVTTAQIKKLSAITVFKISRGNWCILMEAKVIQQLR